jgi:hypothetical protein
VHNIKDSYKGNDLHNITKFKGHHELGVINSKCQRFQSFVI